MGQSGDGSGWIGSHKMDPWTTRNRTAEHALKDCVTDPAPAGAGDLQGRTEATGVTWCRTDSRPVLLGSPDLVLGHGPAEVVLPASLPVIDTAL